MNRIKNNADYFSHDADMRNDIKVKALRKQIGHMGYSLWCFMLETLAGESNFELDYSYVQQELLAADFDVDVEVLNKWVDYCVKIGLLRKDEYSDTIYSASLKQRLESLMSKRESDRERKRQAKSQRESEKTEQVAATSTENDTSRSDLQKRKEAKEKKRKEKESKENTPPLSSPPPEGEGNRTDGRGLKFYPTRDGRERLIGLMAKKKIPKSFDVNDIQQELLRLSLNMTEGSIGYQWIDWWFNYATDEEREETPLKALKDMLRQKELNSQLERFVIPYSVHKVLVDMMSALPTWDYMEACSLIDGPDDIQAIDICKDCLKAISRGRINSPGAFLIKKLRERREAAS